METMRERVPEAAAGELVVPFQVSPEMVEKARKVTATARSDYEKTQALVRSITDAHAFALSYEPVATAPPAETVARGYGNCLALTSIFVGLARQLGLTAYYVDASDRVNDLRREEELIVDAGHIAGVARTERGFTLVDYDGQVADYRTFRIIDDVTALAHYYNNLGYELIDEAQKEGRPIPWEEVRRNFELATMVVPRFARAHNNLGVVYARLKKPQRAEAEYWAAITSDGNFAAPHHNLGNLSLDRGDLDEALAEYDKALSLRRRNPFLHYHRGVALYRRGDLAAAAAAFKRAISLKHDYIEPRNLLAQVYDQQGRHEEAAKIRSAVRLLTESRRTSRRRP